MCTYDTALSFLDDELNAVLLLIPGESSGLSAAVVLKRKLQCANVWVCEIVRSKLILASYAGKS